MANSDNIKNDAALVDVSQIKAINKVSFKQRMKAYKRKPLSLVLLILVGLAAALSAAALIFIIAYVLVRGVPNLTPELFSLEYNSDNVSCMPSIINTIVLTLVTLIISVPFGVYYYGWLLIGTYMAWIWSNELPKNKKALTLISLVCFRTRAIDVRASLPVVNSHRLCVS